MSKSTVVEIHNAKRKVLEKNQENVAAALDQLDTAATQVNKAHGIVKRRLEELDQLLHEYEARLQELETNHEKELRVHREQYTRDTTALQTKLVALEDKLRKVMATLA